MLRRQHKYPLHHIQGHLLPIQILVFGVESPQGVLEDTAALAGDLERDDLVLCGGWKAAPG
jgi:hypothetical protein